MAALDTNVLVRFMVQNEPRQAASARRFVAEAAATGQPLFVPLTVALELEWVLRSRYDLGKDVVVATFSGLLDSRELAFESEGTVEVGCRLYAAGDADFADCLHVASAHASGRGPVWTFDRQAARLAGARLLAG